MASEGVYMLDSDGVHGAAHLATWAGGAVQGVGLGRLGGDISASHRKRL